jgi:hypothetical protein
VTADESGARSQQGARGLGALTHQSARNGEPHGSVAVELALTGRWAISLLTEGWTDEEKAALLAGDEGAREALLDAAEQKTLRQPDDLELVHSRIYLNDPSADQEHGYA